MSFMSYEFQNKNEKKPNISLFKKYIPKDILEKCSKEEIFTKVATNTNPSEEDFGSIWNHMYNTNIYFRSIFSSLSAVKSVPELLIPNTETFTGFLCSTHAPSL